jgi:hypothetical protein
MHQALLSSALPRLPLAHRWRRMLEAGEHGNVRELAKAEKVNETYISRALRLTLLAPDVVEAILDGRQPDGMTLPGLMEGVEVEWGLQHALVPPDEDVGKKRLSRRCRSGEIGK